MELEETDVDDGIDEEPGVEEGRDAEVPADLGEVVTVCEVAEALDCDVTDEDTAGDRVGFGGDTTGGGAGGNEGFVVGRSVLVGEVMTVCVRGISLMSLEGTEGGGWAVGGAEEVSGEGI